MEPMYEPNRIGNQISLLLTRLNPQIPVDILPRQYYEAMKFMPEIKPQDNSKKLLSPMPGAVAHVRVQPGDKVRSPFSFPSCPVTCSFLSSPQIVVGQELVVVEAMKMQNSLRAPADTVVKVLPLLFSCL